MASSSTTGIPAISISRSSRVPAFNSVNVTEGLGPTDAEGSNTFGGAVNFVSLRPTVDDHLDFSELGRLVRHDADLAQRDRLDRQARLRVCGQRLPARRAGESICLGRSGQQLADLLRAADQDEDAELSVLHASRFLDRGDARIGESRLQLLAALRRRLPRLHARRRPRRIERAQRHRRQLDLRLQRARSGLRLPAVIRVGQRSRKSGLRRPYRPGQRELRAEHPRLRCVFAHAAGIGNAS